MIKNLWFAPLLIALMIWSVAQGSPPNVLLIVADDKYYGQAANFK